MKGNPHKGIFNIIVNDLMITFSKRRDRQSKKATSLLSDEVSFKIIGFGNQHFAIFNKTIENQWMNLSLMI